MSEGDVSLIQDEDQLRRMWQQTEDFGRRKEIRAHMYRLREERLKNLYGAEEAPAGSQLAPGPGKRGAGACGPPHSDSFADQSFQSLKSKEVRDAGSPTRDYNFKLDDPESSNAEWKVMSQNEISEDGKTQSRTTIAQAAGEREIEGGKANFAALQESQKSVTQHEDANSKLYSEQKGSTNVVQEQAVSKTDDGTISTSKKSSVATSSIKSTVNQKFDTSEDFDKDGEGGFDQDRFETSSIKSSQSSSDVKSSRKVLENISNVSTSRSVSSSSVKNQGINVPAEGELISRKVEHPDDFTEVVTETRKLQDGSTVTSTTRETRGSYSTKSGRQATSCIDSDQNVSSTAQQFSERSVTSNIGKESKKIMSDKASEVKNVSNYETDIKNSITESVASRQGVDVSDLDEQESESRTNVQETKKAVSNVIDKQSQSIVERMTDSRSASRQDSEIATRKVKNDHLKSSHNFGTSSYTEDSTATSNIDENNYAKIDQIRETCSNVDEDIHRVDKKVLESEFPKPDAKDDTYKKSTTGDYSTTYNSDYTTKRISVDISPTHDAFARSLRSSPDNPLQPSGGSSSRGSTRSLKTSMSSLRSSISPEKRTSKDYRRKSTDRSPSPTKRVSSPVKNVVEDKFIEKKVTENYVSPEEIIYPKKAYTVGGSEPPNNTRESSPGKSPDRYCKSPYQEQPSRYSPERGYDSPSPRSVSPNKYAPTRSTIQETVESSRKTDKIYSSKRPDDSPSRSPARPAKNTSYSYPRDDSPPVSPVRGKTSSPTKGLSSLSPTRKPTMSPNKGSPSVSPTRKPTMSPTKGTPSVSPTRRPTMSPTKGSPSVSPTRKPSTSPSKDSPSKSPTHSSANKKTSYEDKTKSYTKETTTKYRETNVSPTRGSRGVSPTRKDSPVKSSPSVSPARSSASPGREMKSKVPVRTYSRESTPSPTRNVSVCPSRPKDSPKVVRSRDSSPTTSVSEIEFISTNKNSHLITDLDDVDLSYAKSADDVDFKRRPETLNVSRNEITITSERESHKKDSKKTEVKRKSSLKKSSISNEATTPQELPSTTFQVSPDRDCKPVDGHKVVKKDNPEEKIQEKKFKEKPPFVRSETYEERCRKILGMPDKKTLVEGAEKNLSEILGILPMGKVTRRSPSVSSNSPYSSPERELSVGVKSAELVDESTGTAPRKSSLKKTSDSQYRNLVDAEYITVDDKGIVRSADKIDQNIANEDRLAKYKKNESEMFIDNEIKREKDNGSKDIDETNKTGTYTRSKSPEKSPRNLSPAKSPRELSPEKLARTPSPEKIEQKVKVETTKVKDAVDVNAKSSAATRKTSVKETSPKTNERKVSSSTKDFTIKSSIKTTTQETTKVSTSVSSMAQRKESVKQDTKSSPVRKISPDKYSPVPQVQAPKEDRARSTSPIKDKPKCTSTPIKKSPEKVVKAPVPSTTRPRVANQSPEKTNKTVGDIRKTNAYKENLTKKTSIETKQKKYEPTRTIMSTQKYDIFKNEKTAAAKRNEENALKKKETNISSTVTGRKITTERVMTTSRNEREKKKTPCESDSEEEVERAQPRRKSIELRRRNTDEQNMKPRSTTPSAKDTRTQDAKITRTSSDITMKVTKFSPIRNKSKPEINVSKVTNVKSNTIVGNTVNKVSTTTNSRFTTKTQVSTTRNVTSKQRSTLFDKMDHDTIVDIQRAKSSRENSPDKISPVMEGTYVDTGRPRLPDNVQEPDDFVQKRKIIHQTISESDTNISDRRIVELSDDEFDLVKTSNVDRVRGSDECLLTVNEKVNKFLNTTDTPKVGKPKPDSFRKTPSDRVEESLRSDECLMSVSDKVSKFATVSDTKKVDKSQSSVVKDFIKHEVDSNLENDQCLLSVNDKVSRFLSTAEKITEPIRLSDPAPKVGKPDLTKVEKDLKSDECLLSVSDKVNKFINTAEKLTSTEKSPGLVSKASKMISDVKNKFEQFETNVCDIQLNVQKETIASQAKKSTAENVHVKQLSPDRSSPPKTMPDSHRRSSSPKISPDKSHRRSSSPKANTDKSYRSTSPKTQKISTPRMTPEKSPKVNTKPITIMRSSETVKKAKALFENIAVQKSEVPVDIPYRRGTKLTDIGVYKKSSTVESVPDVIPKREVESSPICTESESEVDIAPNVKHERVKYSNGTYNRPGNHPKAESPEKDMRAPMTKTDFGEHKTYVRNQTNGYDVISKTSKKTSETIRNVETVKSQEPEVPSADIISTRRGSGKFGVELRRTSIDQPYVSERRRSSAGEPHLPTIEDIQDVVLLEQMLEKVTGYEQRRRIRSQIRVVKKNMENTGRSEHYHDRSTKQSSTYSREEVKSSNTECRRRSQVYEEETRTKSPSRKPVSQGVLESRRTEIKTVRTPSPGKKSNASSPDRKRDSSPNKRISNVSPTRKEPNQTQRFSTERVVSSTEKNYKSSRTSQDHSERSNYKSTSPERKPSSEKYTGSVKPKTSKVSEYTTAYLRKISAWNNLKPEVVPKVFNVKKDREEKTTTEYQSSYTRKTSSASEQKSEMICKTSKENSVSKASTRSPSPSKPSQSPNERLYVRSPSPELKRPRDEDSKSKTEYQNAFTTFKTKTTTNDQFNTSGRKRVADEKPEWATTNILRKASNTERNFTIKKSEDKNKTIKRSHSPSKAIRKPTDVITSSYGVGPTDENGRPLFGIRALRKHSGANQNFEVKGTVVRQEFHSENGGPPRGQVTVTAYSSNPEDLVPLGGSSRPRGQVTHVTKTTRYGDNTTGNAVSKVYKQAPHKAIEAPMDLDQPRVVRRGSVKSLTEKFIKNAVETSKTEKSSYPKAGLILRTSSFQDNTSDNISSRSSTPGGIVRTGSTSSVNSSEAGGVSRVEKRTTTTTSTSSFLDNSSKVSGVQDILTRMKNADIVVEDGDTCEDSEARALLNKFLGATVLMAGMEGHMNAGRPKNKSHFKQESRTVVTKSSSNVVSDIDDIWDERILRKLLEESSDYDERRKLRARLRQVMAEQEACAQIVAEAAEEGSTVTSSSRRSSKQEESSTVESSSVTTTQKSTSTVTNKVTENVAKPTKPVSPFAKFKQLDKQNSTSSTPSSPGSPLTPGAGGGTLFKFTDPALQASAGSIKEKLLMWCRDKTSDYENVKLDNFSTSWSDGLAFCALIHHFLPEEFDFSKLTPQQRRYNFTLAFKVADEKAGIYPLLDVDDMVQMRKPDWKCVFTYVQAIHRRFKDQD